MVAEKKFGSVKRFGSRYGRTVRYKVAKIEVLQKKKQVCPYCLKKGTKRLSAGIFECNKCGSKFTSKAYFIPKKSSTIMKGGSERSEEDTAQPEE